MASIEKRTRDRQTTWRAHYRTPAGRAAQQDVRPQDRRRAVPRRRRERQGHRDVRRPRAREGDGRRVGTAMAGRAGTPQADHALALRGHPAQAHPPEVGPGQARQRLPQRCPGLGHRTGEGPLPRDGAEDPPRAQPGPRHGGQGRPTRPQRRHRRESAAGHASTSTSTSPTSRSTTSPPRPATQPIRASTAASTPAPTRRTGSSCCSSPTPASGSARWPRSGSPGSTCAADAP